MPNDPSVTKTQAYKNVVRKIDDYYELLDHARFILDNHNAFAKLEIALSGHVRVTWPETEHTDELHTEHYAIEPTLFLKSATEIEDMWMAKQKEEDELEAEKQKGLAELKAKVDERNDRAEYERLKAKYGGEST